MKAKYPNRAGTTVVGCATLLLTVLGTLPAHAAPIPAEGGGVTIRNSNSEKCLEINNSEIGNLLPVQQWTCVGQASSYWTIKPVSKPTGTYMQVSNDNSGKCLDVENSSTSDGARAVQAYCDGTDSQLWYKKSSPSWRTWIINKWSGKCLEVSNSSVDNGARVQQWTCKDIPTMAWYAG